MNSDIKAAKAEVNDFIKLRDEDIRILNEAKNELKTLLANRLKDAHIQAGLSEKLHESTTQIESLEKQKEVRAFIFFLYEQNYLCPLLIRSLTFALFMSYVIPGSNKTRRQ